jgi:hypothetical protein
MDFLKRLHIFEISLIIVVLTVHLYVALSDAYGLPNMWLTRDDAYYYFKVAQNITEGKGSSFDGINPTNGYHPLWMVICIPIFFLARFDLILPLRVLIMVMAVLNVATAIMIYRYIKQNLSEPVAMMASMFWLFNIYIHYTVYEYGLESPIAAFSIVLFIYKLSQFERKWRSQSVSHSEVATLAALALLVLFSRLDLIFLVMIAGLWIIFRNSPIRFFAPLDMVIICASMACSIALRTDIQTYNNEYASPAIQITMIALVIKMTSLYFFGGYQHPRADSVLKTIGKTLLSLLAGTIATTGIYFLLSETGLMHDLPRTAFIIDFLISALLITLLRLAAYWFGSPQTEKDPGPIQTLQLNWRKWSAEIAVYYGVVGGSLLLYMLVNKLAFGSGSPVSGQIKRWWGTLGPTVYEHPPTNWPGFLGLGFKGAYDTWQPTSNFFHWLAVKVRPLYPGADTIDERYYMAMAFSAVIVLILFLANAQKIKNKITNMALIPLMAGCGIHILSYTATAYGGTKEWYWISQMVLVVLIESILLQIVTNPIRKIKFGRQMLGAAAIIAGSLLAARQTAYFTSVMRYNFFPPDRPYMEVLPYLEENTPPGSVIGMTGGGNVGYFIKDRTIVNMDGLINSHDYFQALQAGNAPEYLRQHDLQIIFASPNLLNYPPYFGQFSPYLEAYSVYGGKSLMYLLEEPKYPNE